MAEILLALFVLGVVLTVVTLVGHGIWVLVGRLLRGGQTALDTPDHTARICPRCDGSLSAHARECAVCGWPDPITAGTRHDAVRAELEARLARLQTLGVMDAEARHNLSAALASHLGDASAADVPPIQTGMPANETADGEVVEVEILEAEIVEPEPVGLTADSENASPADRSVTTPRERARRYSAARERAETLATVTEEVIADVPARPRRDTSEVLAAFMQERNIRWGELVGGLLIVGCSIALVISFWAEIADRPLLKFVVFNGVSAALFGAGFYTLKRWQIETTSRGLLIIATLLVPLNFLAIAALTQQAPPTDVLSILGELLSLGMFSVLTYMAGRAIVPIAPLLLTTSVMLTSLMQLVTRRFGGDDMESLAVLYVLAAVPIGCYVVATGLPIAWLWRGADKTSGGNEWTDGALFILLGIATYAALLPLGLLVYQSGAIVDTLSRLSPLVSVFGLPALATGLMHWRRASRPEAATEQTVGVAVGVAGAMVMAIAVGLAWPDPALLLPTTLTTAALFAILALVFEISAAHLVTAVCIIAAWLVGFHVAYGNVGWRVAGGEELARVLLSAVSGNALVPLAGLFAGVAFGFRRVGRMADAFWYLLATAATVVVSLALVVWFGFARAGELAGGVCRVSTDDVPRRGQRGQRRGGASRLVSGRATRLARSLDDRDTGDRAGGLLWALDSSTPADAEAGRSRDQDEANI